MICLSETFSDMVEEVLMDGDDEIEDDAIFSIVLKSPIVAGIKLTLGYVASQFRPRK
jgi:hypothetical protein